MTNQPFTARVSLDMNRIIGEISPLLFGSFLEHIGRAIYGGIYDPTSSQADERGFRRDVLAAIHELNPRIVRYPGGNFVSGYNWLDGVGPREQRPRRRDLAWQSTETNQFGTNEFIEFCRAVNTQPLITVNLGTGSIDEASAWVEYCNSPAGSKFADLRVAHGYREPHGVRYWCLGNEVDGHWQIGHLDMNEYARKSREAAKMMKWQDPTIQLTLAGSSASTMPTFPEWDRVILETCWEHVDYLALHHYEGNRNNDPASYLALAVEFEHHVDTLDVVLRYVKSKLRSKHEFAGMPVHLSWDEWNVWYKNMHMQGGWTEAPHLVEEVYNLEDALVVAQWMSVFLRRCNVLKMACLAQLVNVIAPILTNRETLVKQTIYYPFLLFSKYAAGVALDAHVQSPHYETTRFGPMPLLDVSASYDVDASRSAVFLVNRSQFDAVTTTLAWQGGAPARVEQIYQYAGTDLRAANTFEQPDTLVL
ncbi:MAG: alpha-N-arabinofuranosidase, partial [Chloroflexi bacterium]|nr:alpha-N-arabinofuranosidase [Chloroflexota bacterium]